MIGEVMVSRQPLPNDAHRASCPDPPGSFIYSDIQITIFFPIRTSLLVFPTLVLSRGPERAQVAIERHP